MNKEPFMIFFAIAAGSFISMIFGGLMVIGTCIEYGTYTSAFLNQTIECKVK